MQAYLRLLFPAAQVTLIAVPIAMMIDHLGRGASLLRALATLPLWFPYALLFGLPFLLVGSGAALLLQRLLGDWGRRGPGRLLFILVGAGAATLLVAPLFSSLAPIAAVAGGVATWSASAPAPPPRLQTPVVLLSSLVIGLIVGLLAY